MTCPGSPEYQKQWYQDNKEYLRNKYIARKSKSIYKIRKDVVMKENEEQNIKEAHRKTIFAAGEPTKRQTNIFGVISYEYYSEGDIL